MPERPAEPRDPRLDPMTPVRTVEKLWGREIWHHNDARYCMKTLVLNHGAMSSLHYHREKDETFLVVDGEVEIEIVGQYRKLTAGQSVDLPHHVPHRFRSLTPTATVIEASTTHSDDDVVRMEDARLV